MKKYLIVLVLFGAVIWFIYNREDKLDFVPEHYANYIDGTKSEVFLDCTDDSDCKNVHVVLDNCKIWKSMNINVSKKSIKNFEKTQTGLMTGGITNCGPTMNLDKLIPICEENNCTAERKK